VTGLSSVLMIWSSGEVGRRRRTPARIAVAATCASACLAAAASGASAQAPPPPASPLTPAPAPSGPQQAPPDSKAPAPQPPKATLVSDERGTTYWSRVLHGRSVRAKPSRKSRRVGRIAPYTYYGLRDVVIVLEQREEWSHIRYSGHGGRTGWVPRSALSKPRLTRTWVEISRGRKLLRVYKGKRRVLSARVGIGAKGSPTPGGNFFIRERLVPADKGGIYGVLAFGLSAYSRHRTDWPGGGQVGIHGTNEPRLIPGRISNGCVRMRNGKVRKLDRIVGPGTPVRIR
jgi:lipoprotein-anchoring transpeptidase ErfK/SrfK